MSEVPIHSGLDGVEEKEVVGCGSLAILGSTVGAPCAKRLPHLSAVEGALRGLLGGVEH